MTEDPLEEELAEAEAEMGHNSGDANGGFNDTINATTREVLKDIVARIERMEEEKAAVAEDIKQIYAGAKSQGFDTKVIRRVIRERKKDADERAEEEAMLDLYMSVFG